MGVYWRYNSTGPAYSQSETAANIGDFVPGTVTFYNFLGMGNATETAYPLLLLIFQLSLETRRKHTSRPFPIAFSIFRGTQL